MIIRATFEDIPRIIPCAKEYTDDIPDMPFDSDTYIKYWQGMFYADIGVIYLSVDQNGEVLGGIGGVKFPCSLTGRMIAVECFWYTKKDRRGDGVKLYKKFYNWAKEENCQRIAMIYLPCSMPAELERFYESQGFKLLEMHFEKEII